MNIKILLADDHKIVSDCLEPLLNKQPDMQVVARAENGQMAVRLTQKMEPDVVIMDIAMPDLNGIEATRQILAERPEIKIVALSMHSDSRFIAEMLRSGALGYLLKNCAFEELTKAIHSVVDGQTYLSSGIAEVVTKEYVRRLTETELTAPTIISDREREVLQLLAEGKSTKQVASCLHVSIKTIETHRRQIMRKLNINSLAELIKYAVREGLTSLDS